MKKFILATAVISLTALSILTSCASSEPKYQDVYIVKNIDSDGDIETYERVYLLTAEYTVKDKLSEGDKILVDYNTNTISRMMPTPPTWLWWVGGAVFVVGLVICVVYIAAGVFFLGCISKIYINALLHR